MSSHTFGDFRSALYNNDIDAIIEMSYSMTPEEILYLVQSGKKLMIATALKSYAGTCLHHLSLDDIIPILPRDKTIVLRRYPKYKLHSGYRGSIYIFDDCDLDLHSVSAALREHGDIAGNAFGILHKAIMEPLGWMAINMLGDNGFIAIRNGSYIKVY